MDKLTTYKRSWNMSRIKGKDTLIEKMVRSFLFGKGYRYSLHSPLSGRPDIIFRRKKILVFVNGCFWHPHKDCIESHTPKTNSVFWKKKVSKNLERDLKNYKFLRKEGWKVFILRECEIEKDIRNAVNRLLSALNI